MDVANPDVFWVDNRCYRKNPARNNYGLNSGTARHQPGNLDVKSGSRQSTAPQPYLEDPELLECDPDAPDDGIFDDAGADYDVEEIKNSGAFRTRCVGIPSALYGVAIGPKGTVKKRIETETSTKITIPRMNEPGDIVIHGQKRQDVVRARKRIEILASQARFRREATHFACFPLNSQSVVQNVRDFKEKVLSDFKLEGIGIDEQVFQEPEKIHLTICVLMLLDAAERKKMEGIMNTLKPEIQEMASKGNLRCRLSGLEIMNDDPSQVNVLYAKCVFQEPGAALIQNLADFIQNKLLASGYAQASRSESVKLHATLINTRFRQQAQQQDQGEGGGKGQRNDKRDTFNAKPIIDKYGDFDFGFVEIKEIHISTRHTKGTDGFYKPFAKLNLK